MAKKILRQLKVKATGGAATPAPPLGPALGQAKVNIGEFVTKFNAATQDRRGQILPVVITVYEDKTFDLRIKAPTATSLILKAIGKENGSGKPNLAKIGTISKAKIKEIAEIKMNDLNAATLEGAMKIIEGSARSMGVDVK